MPCALQGKSVVVDRQNFDAGQRRHWLEIASEFPHVEVGGMVMGTSKEVRPVSLLYHGWPSFRLTLPRADLQECRQRLLVRQNHPTIGDAKLAVELLDKFTGLWEEPRLDEVRSFSWLFVFHLPTLRFCRASTASSLYLRSLQPRRSPPPSFSPSSPFSLPLP